MACRDIVDMDEVEAGINECGDTAMRCVEDDPAGRRRAYVARADRGRRIDDNRRQASLRDHRLDQPFGFDLAALIGADRLVG